MAVGSFSRLAVCNLLVWIGLIQFWIQTLASNSVQWKTFVKVLISFIDTVLWCGLLAGPTMSARSFATCVSPTCVSANLCRCDAHRSKIVIADRRFLTTRIAAANHRGHCLPTCVHANSLQGERGKENEKENERQWTERLLSRKFVPNKIDTEQWPLGESRKLIEFEVATGALESHHKVWILEILKLSLNFRLCSS